MRIKKSFLNPKSLEKYGFKQEVIWKDICQYTKKCKWSTVLIHRVSGEVAVVLDGDGDTVNVDDTVYHLIKDGLVEI